MSQVNLLPREIGQRQRTRKLTLAIIAGGVVLVVLIIFAYVLAGSSLSNVNDDIQAQKAANAQLGNEIAQLQPFKELQDLANAKKADLAAAFSNEVSFSGLLLDLSRVMPSNAVLQSLQVTIAAAGTSPSGSAALVGQMSFSGKAVGTADIASMVARLENVKGWVNAFVSSLTQELNPSGGVDYTFQGTLDLSKDVLTRRGAGSTAAGP